MDKVFKKFYEVGNNAYYILNISDEVLVGTESFVEAQRPIFGKILKPKRITQDFKMLEITPSIGILFDQILNCRVVETNEEFPDMNKYEPINPTKVRNVIEKSYVSVMESKLEDLENQFKDFLVDLEFSHSEGKMTDEEYARSLDNNTKRHEVIIKRFKESNPFNNLDLKIPRGVGYNDIVKKMINEGFNFLYTQKIGSNLQITYLYEFDQFGTLTIYKVQLVKNVFKKMETFIYNIDIIRELVAYMANHNL